MYSNIILFKYVYIYIYIYLLVYRGGSSFQGRGVWWIEFVPPPPPTLQKKFQVQMFYVFFLVCQWYLAVPFRLEMVHEELKLQGKGSGLWPPSPFPTPQTLLKFRCFMFSSWYASGTLLFPSGLTWFMRS